jgi:hypothetical protein
MVMFTKIPIRSYLTVGNFYEAALKAFLSFSAGRQVPERRWRTELSVVL